MQQDKINFHENKLTQSRFLSLLGHLNMHIHVPVQEQYDSTVFTSPMILAIYACDLTKYNRFDRSVTQLN